MGCVANCAKESMLYDYDFFVRLKMQHILHWFNKFQLPKSTIVDFPQCPLLLNKLKAVWLQSKLWDAIPDDWLSEPSDTMQPDEKRAAYVQFLSAKLANNRRVFVMAVPPWMVRTMGSCWMPKAVVAGFCCSSCLASWFCCHHLRQDSKPGRCTAWVQNWWIGWVATHWVMLLWQCYCTKDERL